MQRISINPAQPDTSSVDQIASVLRDGGVVIYPTDTCYGIGSLGGDLPAQERILQLKRRPSGMTLSMIFTSVDQIAQHALVDERTRDILTAYLPGPYSFLLSNTDYDLKQSDEIMVRIPDYPLTQMLAAKLNHPYTTTSANTTGQPPAYSVEELNETLLADLPSSVLPDFVVDAGLLPANPPSTIVDLKHWPPRVIRQGAAIFKL